MPALYEKVRDSCIEKKSKDGKSPTKQQMQECKKMAAIYYFKKTGKPVNKEHATEILSRELEDNLFFHLDINDKNAESIEAINNDKAVNIYLFGDECLAEVKVETLGEKIIAGMINTSAPFNKTDVHYREELQELNTRACDLCVHYVNIYPGVSLCHLVNGLIEWNHICDYYSKTLLYEEEDEQHDYDESGGSKTDDKKKESES